MVYRDEMLITIVKNIVERLLSLYTDSCRIPLLAEYKYFAQCIQNVMRCLRLYEGTKTTMNKPRKRLRRRDPHAIGRTPKTCERTGEEVGIGYTFTVTQMCETILYVRPKTLYTNVNNKLRK